MPSGQPVAILGPNGAGKTTFVRMVATLFQPDRGRLVIGYDVVDDPMAVRRMIGLAGQSAVVEAILTVGRTSSWWPASTGRAAAETVPAQSGSSSRCRPGPWPATGR